MSILRGNLPWILLSVMISVGLWILVTVEVDPVVTNTIGNIQVEVQNAPKTVLVQPAALVVDVTVSAPSDVWPELNVAKFRAILDASKAVPGAQDLPVTIVSLDPRARVESWTPDKITLRVDPLQSKLVPVQVIQQGAVPDLYQSGLVRTTPVEVTVSGPQSSVDQVTTAVVEVSLDGMTSTIDKSYVPIPETDAGAHVDRVTIVPEAVLVEVPIEQKLLYKTVPLQPKLQGNVSLGYQVVGVTIDPSTVTLVGDPKTLNQLQFISTQAVNIEGATSDREVTIDLELPGTVALARSQSTVVRVLVTSVNGSKTILVSPRILNGAPTVNYSVTPGAVNVTISGPIPVLSHLGPDDVPVVVDAHGVVTGTMSFHADATVPPLVHLDSIEPASVVLAVK
ncbi:MAG TPA: CdaR family protein [Chloroflexota bacterium]|nr:CdaR family protein [Chloroflexota bacterium]